MAQFKPYKIENSQLSSLPIVEGQLVLVTDTKKLYFDINDSQRIQVSADAVVGFTVSGTKVTYTKADGTTGSFNTQDTNTQTITGVKGNSESSYRTGNVNITKANIGLGNVENKSSETIRSEITSANVTTALGYTPLNAAIKGKANGVAELDADGKVPSSQLPSYVDDVLEYSAKSSFPASGETGKIYVDLSNNKTYRWSGSAYTEISASLALGETESTAYRGDRGAAAYKHAVTNKGIAAASGLYKITTNSEGHVTAAAAVQKSDITALGIPAQDTTYSNATTSAAGLMSASDKTKLNGLSNYDDTELSTALENLTDTVEVNTANIANKVDKVSGKGLSTNDYTTTEKNKLASLSNYDDSDIVADIEEINTAISTQNTTISGIQTTVANKVDKVGGKQLSTNDFTNELKTKLEGIATGANKTTVDSSLSSSSSNPVQNKVINTALGTKVDKVDGKGLSTNDYTTAEKNKLAGLSNYDDSTLSARVEEVNDQVEANKQNIASHATSIANKVDKVSGKGLSTNDYTTTEKNKLAGLSNYDDTSIKSRVSTLETDLGELEDTVAGHTTSLGNKVDKVSGKGLSTNDYTTTEKNKLAGIAANANNYSLPTASASTLGGVKVGTNLSINSDGVLNATDTKYNNMTGATSAAAGTSGLVPAPAANKQNAFLKGDGTWATPANTEYGIMTGATASTDGTNGLVPAPTKGNQAKFLRADGTWQTPTNTTYSAATTSANGLMSSTDKAKLDGIAAGAQVNTITGVKGNSESSYRTGNVNITKANIGLGNVENKTSETIRGEITSSNVTTALGFTPLNAAVKGAANGVASLDANGKVPTAQLPSYVDDVLEYSAKSSFPTTGETGKIYVDTSTNKTWRWSGSAYVEISASLALGTTSSTAYRGDYGNTAYTHSQITDGNPHGTDLADLGVTATATELNYVDGVTSAIQTQLNGKAPTSHASSATTYGAASASNYGHAKASATTPKAAGTAAVGSETSSFARGDHVHPLQTTVSGNAGTATKLATARNIALTGAITGTASFDGSANASITTTSSTLLKDVKIQGQKVTVTRYDGTTTTNSGYTITQNNSTANTWHKLGTFNTKTQGAGGEIWLFGGQGQNSFTNQNMWAHLFIKKGYQGSTASTTNYVAATYEIFAPAAQAATYKNVKFKIFCTEIGVLDVWVYFPYTYSRAYFYPAGEYDSFTVANTETTTEPVASDTNGVLQPISGGLICPSLHGATVDGAIKGLSASGKTITYTKGDGTTGTITTQDTTYSAATTSANGLMSSTDKTNLNGAIKGLSVSGRTITYTKVDGSTGTITTQDNNTTYSNMTAATASAAGTAGLVPAPAAGKQTSFLRGDGTWVVPTDTNTHYTSKLYAGTSSGSANAATTNGNTNLILMDDSTVRNRIVIKGTGATTVTSDANGVITINSTNTTYSAATTSANGLMTSSMVTKLNGIATGANKTAQVTVSSTQPSSMATGDIWFVIE